mmetsp:Transcript_21906/g.26648  ORF Transcript_21906/g.26648 Transcript_21906/m.26648 type:complete len:491 (-) Transcript_21906:1338-2810(-)|eukprot:CAMPEP_0204869908 /NCGR_PEP_ID=MMETSP1348-20121228/30971_1 /ASSEMBLY_ACC=CAM_ASM_000700 /TAXON_ID=215587 /ORGANISM="Aplanochytrium stocchinoi, Strain GSBS06" /LENGTH=490 /DNA_ID=CAMNT_0052023443 /DNA_START=35 /DNA_END=1507 /DNA_ORIENTATION=-
MEEFDGILVVGAGLVGTMAALTLARRGFKVKMFEGRPDWRLEKEKRNSEEKENAEDKVKSAVKRSINLALSRRGQEALKNIGLLDEAMKNTIPMHCRAIHTKRIAHPQADTFQPYDEVDPGNFINSISREELNELLLKTCEKEKVQIIFNHKLMSIDKNGTAHFTTATNSGSLSHTYNDYAPGSVQIKPRLLLGCDGAYSVTREALGRLTSLDFERLYISHGYKELHMPPASDGDFALETPEALHIWPRDEFMMIGLPNGDKSFTCTIFAPMESTEDVPGLLDLKKDNEIKQYFGENFPDVTTVIPDFVEQFQRNPSCRLVSVSAKPWNLDDRILLLGDAAHAMVPFYGQGMNCGFEDVLEFDETLKICGNDLSKAVPRFAQVRRERANACRKLSYGNYIEMRSHTGSKLFLMRKKFEGILNWLFPKTWIPLYKMVTFTRIPYDQVIERSKAQDRILNNLIFTAFFSGSIGMLYGLVQFSGMKRPGFINV